MYRSVNVRNVPYIRDNDREMDVVMFIESQYKEGWLFVSQLQVKEHNGIGVYVDSFFLLFKREKERSRSRGKNIKSV